jgi:tryptophan synthase alpha chain
MTLPPSPSIPQKEGGNGPVNRIDAALEAARAAGRMGLFPYLTAGYPDLDATEDLALAMFAAGADGLELGVPFSDPMADGATLQRASEVALANGASLAWTLGVAAQLRAQAGKPILLMGYYNPIHRFGPERFASAAVEAGVDGVIVPDLPSTEAGPFATVAESVGLHLIQMIAPTTTPARLAEVGRTARGFVYCVSLLGTTGARAALSHQLPGFLQTVRGFVSQPLLVGFGIAQPEHIRGLRPYADAVVVGGAIADLLARTPPAERARALGAYIGELAAACTADSAGATAATP